MPLPTSTNPTPFFESAAMPSDEARKQEWEEPHPGRRLSCPHDRVTTWGVYAGDEGRRGGMAAEGLWPGQAKFNFALPTSNDKRLGRSRTRAVPAELNLTNVGRARPEIRTAPLPRFGVLYRDDNDDGGQDIAAATIFEDSSREGTPVDTPGFTPETSGTDSDTDSFISGPARKRQALQPLNTSVQELPCTDFSNHLGIMDVQNVTSFTMAEPEVAAAFSVMSPESDLWGWNAVLERKDTQSCHEAFAPYQQQRANRSKRSLLQRVFSPGGSSADDSLSKSPTSFVGLDYEAQGR